MRWRHCRIEYEDEMLPPIDDGIVYTNGADPPHMAACVAHWTGDSYEDDDILYESSHTTDEDGRIAITGRSDWLISVVGVTPPDSVMTIYVTPNTRECKDCQ